jgi:probable rRNA maturation factor
LSVALEVDVSLSDGLAAHAEGQPVPDAELIRQWACSAYLDKADRVVSVQLMSRDEIQQLNRDWRGKDSATNVLSFPMQLDDDTNAALFSEGDHAVPLGDLALCAEVINREAKQQGKTINAHWAHMVVHGMLHLQGYDHIEDEQADAMEALEIKHLQQLGFANPYLPQT